MPANHAATRVRARPSPAGPSSASPRCSSSCVEIRDSASCSTSYPGGGGYVAAGSLALDDVDLDGHATSGLDCEAAAASVSLASARVTNNGAHGIHCPTTSVSTLQDVVVHDNGAHGIYAVAGDLDLSDVDLSGKADIALYCGTTVAAFDLLGGVIADNDEHGVYCPTSRPAPSRKTRRNP